MCDFDLWFSEILVAQQGLCDREGRLDLEKGLECDPSDQSLTPLVLIFMSQFLSGIGGTLFMTLAGPFLDDNMKQVIN
jgi:hypothetical protein